MESSIPPLPPGVFVEVHKCVEDLIKSCESRVFIILTNYLTLCVYYIILSYSLLFIHYYHHHYYYYLLYTAVYQILWYPHVVPMAPSIQTL